MIAKKRLKKRAVLNDFDATIRKVFGQSVVRGDIGCEIEAEFVNKKSAKMIGDKFWRTTEDGSLRGGLEYVLVQPVTLDDLPLALKEFEKGSKGIEFKFSNRCSVHVHINIQDLKLHEFVKACTAWWLIENLMTRTQGANREGNLFALRGKDADHYPQFRRGRGEWLQEAGTYGSPRSDENQRYAALNLAALHKFGSMEFRFLNGTGDIKELDFWCRTLYNFVHNARRMSIGDMVEAVAGSSLDKMTFLRKLLGDEAAHRITQQVGSSLWPTLLEENIHYGVLLQSAFDTAMTNMLKPKSVRLNVEQDDDLETGGARPFEPRRVPVGARGTWDEAPDGPDLRPARQRFVSAAMVGLQPRVRDPVWEGPQISFPDGLLHAIPENWMDFQTAEGALAARRNIARANASWSRFNNLYNFRLLEQSARLNGGRAMADVTAPNMFPMHNHFIDEGVRQQVLGNGYHVPNVAMPMPEPAPLVAREHNLTATEVMARETTRWWNNEVTQATINPPVVRPEAPFVERETQLRVYRDAARRQIEWLEEQEQIRREEGDV